MAEDDDWEGREGRWTRSSESSEGGGGERYYELPDGEVVQGEPEGDVEAEPVEEDEEGGLAGLFGGDDDDDEPDEEIEDDEEDDGSIVPIVAGVVVLLLVLLVLLVGAAYLGIADPLGIGDSLGGDGGDDGTGGGGDDDGDGDTNETQLFEWPVNWTISSNTLSNSSEEEMNQGETLWANVTIARANITTATLRFQWDDSGDSTGDLDTGSNNDTFRVTITAPDGTEDTVEEQGAGGGKGFINITLDLASVPNATTVQAENESAAKQQVLTQYPTMNATTGTWAIKIELVEANPCVTAGGTADPDDGPDCSNSWQYDLEYSWYDHLLGEPTEVES